MALTTSSLLSLRF